MRRARLLEQGHLVLEDAPAPMPGRDEVRVAVHACGVCGSDLHHYHGRHPFNRYPVVPGHEFSGHVDAVGAGVTAWQPGQRVSVEPNLACGRCEPCREGRYNICESLVVLGGQTDGAMAEYIVVPADKVVPIPDTMAYDIAALIEPTAVAVHAVRRLSLDGLQRLLVIGVGTIGLQVVQAARAFGVPEVVATDLRQARLDRAAQMGATQVVNVAKEPLAEWMQRMYGRSNPMDAAIECVGAGDETLNGAIAALKKGRRLVVVGVWGARPPLQIGLVQRHELEVVGTLMYTMADFTLARDMLSDGRILGQPLITARYPLERVTEAFAVADGDPDRSLKTMIMVRSE